MINTTFASVCAVILLGLILYTQGRKVWARRRGKAVKCQACGRAVVDSPVKIEEGDIELFFCCEHCADAYMKGGRNGSGGKAGKDDG